MTKEALAILNHKVSRKFLNIEDELPIIKYTANSVHRLVKKNKNELIIKASFWTFPRVKELLELQCSPQVVKQFNYRFLDSNFNPNAGGEGIVSSGSQSTWAAARGHVGASADGSATRIQSWNFGSGFVNDRCMLPFDTSALTAGAVISASDLNLYRDDFDTFANADTTSVEIVPSGQTDPTSIEAADYNNVTFTSKGTFAVGSTSNGAYFSITITDLTALSKTSYTKFAAITGRDLNNTQPTGRNQICFQDSADTNPPRLDVTYTVAVSGGGAFLNNLI